jgi:hypothetical protein
MLDQKENQGYDLMVSIFVTTLALGSQPKQRLAKVPAKREAHESHFMLPRMWEAVRE